jgi:putative lipase involved disintegration of autophagic bodies
MPMDLGGRPRPFIMVTMQVSETARCPRPGRLSPTLAGDHHRCAGPIEMRRVLHLLCFTLILAFASAKQQPLLPPASFSQYQPFSAIAVLDVGVGPQYQHLKRYLPVYPTTFLHSVLHADIDSSSLQIRSLSRTTTQHVHISRDTIDFALSQSRQAKYSTQSALIPWTKREILVPDVTDLTTVTTLAQIANNAYIEIPKTFDWIDVNGPWNLSSDFGWEKNGLRGHVFASERNETIIISLKGTSPAVFLGGGTGGNDKVNVSSLSLSLSPPLNKLIPGQPSIQLLLRQIRHNLDPRL